MRPGIGKILILLFKHSLISIVPGSERAGVPASEMSDTVESDFNISIILDKFFFSLNL